MNGDPTPSEQWHRYGMGTVTDASNEAARQLLAPTLTGFMQTIVSSVQRMLATMPWEQLGEAIQQWEALKPGSG